MNESNVTYVGPPEIHDGSIMRLEQQYDRLAILRDYTGSVWELSFTDVTELMVNKAEGMILYALAEFSAMPPLRRFVFINWDEENDAFLQVVAQSLAITESLETL